MTAKSKVLCAAVLATLMAACGDEAAPADFAPDLLPDAAADTHQPPAPDAGPALPDSAPSQPDARPDAGNAPDAVPVPDAVPTPDAQPDLPTATPDAGSTAPDSAAPDAGPAQPDAAAPDAAPEASVDAPADTVVDSAPAADARDAGQAACYWQGPTGPVACQVAYPGGRGYCNAGGACTMCESPNWLNCDGNDQNGCDTVMDDQNCGKCGLKCPGVTHCVWAASGGYACR